MSHIIKFEHPLKDDEYKLINVIEGDNLSAWISENLFNKNWHILLNDEVIDDTDYVIQQHDVITIRPILEFGVDWVVWVALAVSVASAVYAYSMMPDQVDNAQTQQASSVYNYNGQGNKPRLGNPVAVQYGRMPHYPDLISPPWFEYINNEQFYYQVFSKGVGKFEIHGHYIGETSLENYEGDIERRVYQPNELVNHFPHIVWTSSEVGGSDGQSGLELLGAVTNSNLFISARSFGFAEIHRRRILIAYVTNTNNPTNLRWPWKRNEYVWVNTTFDLKWSGVATFVDGLHGPDKIQFLGVNSFFGVSAGDEIMIDSEGSNSGRFTVHSKSVDNSTLILRSDMNGGLVDNFVPGDFVIQILSANRNDGIYLCEDDSGTVSRIRAESLEKIPEWNGFIRETRVGFAKTFDTKRGSTWSGDFVSCPEGTESKDIAVDFILPQGIGYSNNDGSLSARNLQVEIRARRIGQQNYITRTLTFTQVTRTPQRITFWLNREMGITSGRWEIGARKITQETEDARALDQVNWSGLKSVLQTDYRNEHETIITLKIRATNALSQQANQKYWVDSTRILEVKQANETYLEQPTSSIADALIDACRNEIYGAGMSDDALDLDTIIAYKDKWLIRRDTCNGLFDQPIGFWEAITKILQNGRAYPRIDFGTISLWRDEPRQSLCKPYSPVNMTPDSFSADIRLLEEDDYDGVELEWFNPTTRKSETILCTVAGQNGFNPKQLKLPFITNEYQARREGMFHAAVQAYRRTNISFKTDIDGWESNYGDLIPVAHDSMLWGQSGQVLEVLNQNNNRYLQLSGLLDWTPEQQHYVIFNAGNSGIHGPYRVQKTEVHDIVILIDAPTQPVIALGERGKQPSHYMFGVAEKLYKKCILMKVKQSGEFAVTCEAIEEDSRMDNFA